jgi:hypothetical protein
MNGSDRDGGGPNDRFRSILLLTAISDVGQLLMAHRTSRSQLDIDLSGYNRFSECRTDLKESCSALCSGTQCCLSTSRVMVCDSDMKIGMETDKCSAIRNVLGFATNVLDCQKARMLTTLEISTMHDMNVCRGSIQDKKHTMKYVCQ